MKKTLWTTLLLAVLLVSIPMSGLAETMYVNTSNHKSVNLRDDMSTNAEILCSVPYGKAVTVIEMLDGSSWVNCTYDGYYGYIMNRYLSYDKPSPAPMPTKTKSPSPTPPPANIYDHFVPAYYTALVNPTTPGGFVNMRWAPSKNAPVFAICYNNTELEVFYSNGTWCQVYNPVDRTFGYMMSSFLRNVGNGGDGFGSRINMQSGAQPTEKSKDGK